MAARSASSTPFMLSAPSTPSLPASASPSHAPGPPSQPRRAGPAPALTATLTDGALVLSSADGLTALRVPLPGVAPAGPVAWDGAALRDGAAPDVAHVCTLDTALARRLFRRVSAWHLDAQGCLSARVRPTA